MERPSSSGRQRGIQKVNNKTFQSIPQPSSDKELGPPPLPAILPSPQPDADDGDNVRLHPAQSRACTLTHSTH